MNHEDGDFDSFFFADSYGGKSNTEKKGKGGSVERKRWYDNNWIVFCKCK